MSYDLAMMARRAGVRRDVTFRPIFPTQSQAQDLAKLYLDVVKAWERADLLQSYDGATRDSPSDSAATIEQVENEISRLVLAFGVNVRQWAIRIERWHRDKWAAAVLSSTGVDIKMMLSAQPVQETIETFIARNVALVKDVSDQARGRISDAVFRGYQQRQPAREVAKAIREATGMARDRSVRIASHQTANLSAAFDRERKDEAGISLFRWRHSGKRNPRADHKARDGLVYFLKTGKPYQRSGETIPADDRAGVPPYCGCREQAYLPIMDE